MERFVSPVKGRYKLGETRRRLVRQTADIDARGLVHGEKGSVLVKNGNQALDERR